MLPKKNLVRNFKKAIKQPFYATKLLKNRFIAQFMYKFRNGNAPFPEALTFFLTYKCNLKCKMCGQWGNSGVTKTYDKDVIKQDLGISDWKKIIDEVSIFKPSITLFGGEPLIYNEFPELLKYIKEKKMHCVVITNGVFIEKYYKEILYYKLDELNISIDGDENLHEYIRGIPGIYSKIKNGLSKIAEIKEEKKIKYPLINLQCTISDMNYDKLDKLLDVYEELKADSITFHNLIFLSEEELMKQKQQVKDLLGVNNIAWEGFLYNHKINPGKLFLKIKEINTKKGKKFINFYPNFSEHELKNYYNSENWKSEEYSETCLSPWLTCYVFPDGSIRSCLNIEYQAGNILNEKLINIWNGEKMKEFRKVIKNIKYFKACLRCTEFYRY